MSKGYAEFRVRMPREEGLALVHFIEEHDEFSLEDRNKYRGNGLVGEYVHWLAEQELEETDSEELAYR